MKKICKPHYLFIIGLMIGVIIRMFDIYCDNLGNIFSQVAIWILLSTLISIYTSSRKVAMLNVFLFNIGMLITYYLVAYITKGVFGTSFIFGWMIFACCTPILAYFAWFSKERGLFAILIRIGIVIVSVLSSIILFDRLRIYDILINGLLIYFLFFRKIER